MNMLIIDNEGAIRLVAFVAVFSIMALWEIIAPRRPLTQRKGLRWMNNLAITLLNTFTVRVVFPSAAVGAAVVAHEKGWGIVPLTGLSDPAAGVLCMVALDFVIYSQHALFHRVPLLWRLHRMHHTDLDVDVTTGARFHPVEILLSMLIKMSAVALLGAPAWSVVAFEVLLNATSLFNHSNVGLPASVDRMLRLLLVTPDMHRVHHSVIIGETNSNFGFSLSWWDRIFGTYRREASAGNENMTLGLANYRDRKWLTLHWMLVSPFAGPIR